MVRYQNLTRKPELFRASWPWAPLGPGPGTMYPLNLPLAGPGYHLNFMKNLRQSKLCVCFFEKWTSFSWYCCLAETKTLFIICIFFFLSFSYQKQISNIKSTKIHTAYQTLDNLWTFLTTVYQQCEKKYWQKTKVIALMLASNFFINKYVYTTK